MNGGSFFFAEIRRITSSERPGGTLSASMSVTKPCAYSRLINSSMWVVSVSMDSAGHADQRARDRRDRAKHLVEGHLFQRPAKDLVDRLLVGAYPAGGVLLGCTRERAALGHAERHVLLVGDARHRDLRRRT